MDKPLPSVPEPKPASGSKHTQSSASLATLSVEVHAHLRKFVLHAVSEEADVIPEPNWEDWTSAIEGALGQLGERIALGGWLVGLRRARTRGAQNREREQAKRTKSAETVASRREELARTLKAKINDESYFSVGRLTGRSVVTVASQPIAVPELPSPIPTKESLQSLRDLASRPSAPAPKPTAKHLLLTVSPLHSAPLEGTHYDLPRSRVYCVFTPGVFAVPEDMTSGGDEHGLILYGLDTWDASLTESDTPLQLVGGTFSLQGVNTDAQHQALVKILRLSLFVYLSCILEQSLLADSHVPLRFPKPSLSPTSPIHDAGTSIIRALSTGHVGNKVKHDQPSGLWAFFSKKKEDLLHRAVPVRRGSLELPLARKPSARERSPATPRVSHDATSPPPRARRFSFITDYKPAFLQVREEKPSEPVERPYTATLNRIEKFRPLLSTSPGIALSPPSLLVSLATREKREPKLRLGGDEKAALSYLLGWEGKDSHGAGMADMTGFVRQQSFSVLYSEYIPHSSSPISRPTTPGGPSQSSNSTLSMESTSTNLIPCGRRRRWVTFRFYARDADETLGEAVARICTRAEEPCQDPACRFTQGEHELRYVHDRVRIHVNCRPMQPPTEDEELPDMWESCTVCGKISQKVRMQDATYLLSYAKFLELLVYSTSLCTLSPALCSHTAPPPRPWIAKDSPLPRTRMNIARHFSFRDRVVSFTLEPVEDVFEVRVPRLQILRHKNMDRPEASDEHLVIQETIETERRALRREIMQFWQVLSEHMDTLECNFSNEHGSALSYHKSLPRLPSADDAYSFDDDDGMVTPKGGPSKLPPLPPNTPRTPQPVSSKQSYPFPRATDGLPPRSSAASSPNGLPPTPDEHDSLALLTNLRHAFQRTEQSLYSELSHTPVSTLNDVRRSFHSAARGATKRLSAWEVKHTPKQATAPAVMAQCEPEWWRSGCHAVPGGNVIVREDDWGSIIAFTLSSSDYQKELANMGSTRSVFAPSVSPSTPPVTRPSFFEKTRWFGSSSSLPDPDMEGVVWHEPEAYSAVISRKEHPRDAPSLLKLGLPEVLRQKAFAEFPGNSGNATPLGSNLTVGAPPSAWAKPEVQVSKEAADGLVSAGTASRAGQMLQELEATTTDGHGTVSTASVETAIRRGKASSLLSSVSDSTAGEQSTSTLSDAHHPLPPPPPPPKDLPETPSDPGASSLTQTLSSALRYMLSTGRPLPPPPPSHHGLLHSSAASPTIDERPHIKYDWTIGKRLRFSCTVYYARQFDALRKRCGVDVGFLSSLARSKNWAADGGKSRSNFWKTEDGRFIIKTLVNAWNVADLHVLLELGPAYFRYMDATANRPTALAKLLGFYTVEIKNLETGTTQAKADLLVMENLFFSQEIVRTFDLKGIQGRKVKTKTAAPGGTLFDGDWIEGQQRALTLVQPYSKVVLQEAIKADCEFLAKSNIMDYSLLVGIDESRKQIACGLVDTIGSYTFAKTLEYKAKQGLNSGTGKEVTVIPPHEYQERFVNAMDMYFVACPDRWSRPLDDTQVPGDWRALPSVL